MLLRRCDDFSGRRHHRSRLQHAAAAAAADSTDVMAGARRVEFYGRMEVCGECVMREVEGGLAILRCSKDENRQTQS